MKRLITVIGILLTLLAGPSWAVEPINLALAPAILGGAGAGAAAGCTASYGAELATNNNATDIGGAETDATTGWASSSAFVDSVDTGTPRTGDFHIIATASGSTHAVYRTFSGLDASTVYKWSIYIKHDGTPAAAWKCGHGYSTLQINRNSISIPVTQTSYTNHTHYFLYNSLQDYWDCQEDNASNIGSIYLDDASLTTATLCYGNELYTDANAANIASEVDATTGWTALADSTISSDEDATPHNGSSHLKISTTGAAGGAYADLSALASPLQEGTKYFIRFWAKNDNSNNWYCSLSGANNTANAISGDIVLQSGNGTYVEYGWSFTHTAATSRYLVCIEGNAGNTGYVYLDGISIKEIVSE